MKMYSVVIYSAIKDPDIIIAHSKTEVKTIIDSLEKGQIFAVYDYFDNNVTFDFLSVND